MDIRLNSCINSIKPTCLSSKLTLAGRIMLFTVCTPAFNRAHTLERVFDSLVTQTLRDFEWLVVDDTSSDDTEALINRLASIADFQIRYSYQENQGKHIAVNRRSSVGAG